MFCWGCFISLQANCSPLFFFFIWPKTSVAFTNQNFKLLQIYVALHWSRICPKDFLYQIKLLTFIILGMSFQFGCWTWWSYVFSPTWDFHIPFAGWNERNSSYLWFLYFFFSEVLRYYIWPMFEIRYSINICWVGLTQWYHISRCPWSLLHVWYFTFAFLSWVYTHVTGPQSPDVTFQQGGLRTDGNEAFKNAWLFQDFPI